jgi:hypothetical protein
MVSSMVDLKVGLTVAMRGDQKVLRKAQLKEHC